MFVRARKGRVRKWVKKEGNKGGKRGETISNTCPERPLFSPTSGGVKEKREEGKGKRKGEVGGRKGEEEEEEEEEEGKEEGGVIFS